jgi:hypothetical protein
MSDGVYNALDGRRTMAPVPSSSRRRCSCGCGKRASHMMLADGCCMGIGCELLVRRWIRNPVDAWLTRRRLLGEGE